MNISHIRSGFSRVGAHEADHPPPPRLRDPAGRRPSRPLHPTGGRGWDRAHPDRDLCGPAEHRRVLRDALAPSPGGQTGGLAFFAVCGLLGGSLATVGLRLYLIVDEIGARDGFSGSFKREAIGDGLANMLWQAGLMLGLALTVYLLAPTPTTSEDP